MFLIVDRGLPALQAKDKRLIVSFNHTIMPFSLLSAALLTCTAPFLFSCFYLLLTSLSNTLSCPWPLPPWLIRDFILSLSTFSKPFLSCFLFFPYFSHPPVDSTSVLLPPFSPSSLFLLFFLLRSSMPFLSLRCRMLWAMSCHGSILSLLSSSALFSFSISFWECWAGKRLCCYYVCMCSRCVVWLYLLF